MKRWQIGLIGLLAAAAALCANVGKAQVTPEIVRRGKAATALIEVANGSITGSAFCISPAGLFVTNEHVVDTIGPSGTCSLIVQSGEREQKRLTARVVRMNKDLDLALLEASSNVPLPVLPLGNSDSLIETQELVVFGFPFGRELSAIKDDYPSVTVTAGRLTALRKAKGALVELQIDAAVHPGNSGGPVLNSKGQVIGIVVAKFRKAEGINLAIPVNQLEDLLHKVEVVFTPAPIPAAQQHSKQEFVMHVVHFGAVSLPYDVEFSLKAGSGAPRNYPAYTTDGGKTYHAWAIPLPAVEAPGGAHLRLTIQDGTSEVVGRVKERSFKVGGVETALSRCQEIRLQPEPGVTLLDGRVLSGAVTGLGDAEVEVAGTKALLHLSRAVRISVEDVSAAAPAVTYHIVVKRQNEVVAETQGELPLVGSAIPAPTPANLQGSPALRFEEARKYAVPEAGDVVLAADMDGDRRSDVVIGGSKEIGVLYGKPDGTLEPYQPLLKWEAGIRAREIVDMNGDGRPDIVFLDGLGKLVILYNRGGRKFSEPVFQSIDCNGALYVGDLNRDGRPDIVVGISGDGGAGAVRVLINQGDGTFHVQSEFRHIGIVEGVTARDINGDGIPDLAVSYETSTVGRSGVSIYYGDGKGGFRDGPGYDIGTMNMTSPTFADLNGDGKPDLLLCNYWGGNVAVFLNKGDGTFLPPTRYPAHAYPILIRVADFNRDGRPDFVVACAGTSTVSVYRNRGNGLFDDPVVLEVGGGDCRSVFVADFNRDGRPDLVTQNQSDHTISVLINRTGE